MWSDPLAIHHLRFVTKDVEALNNQINNASSSLCLLYSAGPAPNKSGLLRRLKRPNDDVVHWTSVWITYGTGSAPCALTTSTFKRASGNFAFALFPRLPILYLHSKSFCLCPVHYYLPNDCTTLIPVSPAMSHSRRSKATPSMIMGGSWLSIGSMRC